MYTCLVKVIFTWVCDFQKACLVQIVKKTTLLDYSEIMCVVAIVVSDRQNQRQSFKSVVVVTVQSTAPPIVKDITGRYAYIYIYITYVFTLR